MKNLDTVLEFLEEKQYRPTKTGERIYYICGSSQIGVAEIGLDGLETPFIKQMIKENRVFKTRKLAEKCIEKIKVILLLAEHK